MYLIGFKHGGIQDFCVGVDFCTGGPFQQGSRSSSLILCLEK